MRVFQVLDRHRSPVTRLCWCKSPTPKHPADRLTLASADATGAIVVWNVKSGEVKATMQEGKSVSHMEWLDGRFEGSGHLLAALHPPFAFVLWDTATGEKVWRKTYTETLQGFDFDPFDANRIAFR
jgi:WD40 repeat protein